MPFDCLWSCFRAQEAPLISDDDDTVSLPGDNSNQVKHQALEKCSHIYKVTRFHRLVRCALCSRIIWGLGRRSFKCIKCNEHLHKGCHHLPTTPYTSVSVLSEDWEMPPDSLVQCEDWEMPSGPVQSEDWEMPSGPVQSEDWEMPPEQVFTEISLAPAKPSLQDFDLIKFLGRGGFGKVLKVQQKDTKQFYAMKVVKKHLVYGEEDTCWVHTEKRVFQEGCNYPFLVGLHSTFQTEHRLFFVIEYVEGNDLRSLITSQEKLEAEQTAFYTAEISLALNYLHMRGIIHRDIKPENILLDAQGHAKVTDYGLCKEGLYPGDTTTSFCGTPFYIAPEMLLEIPYDYSVDWWSLGITSFEMMAGCVPFTALGPEYYPDTDPRDILYENILEQDLELPDYFSAEAADITISLLKKDPKHRLGCSNSSFADLQVHPFFKGIDWELLENRKVLPPFLPSISEETGDSDPDYGFQFTPPEDPKAMMDIDQLLFQNFDWFNPNWQ